MNPSRDFGRDPTKVAFSRLGFCLGWKASKFISKLRVRLTVLIARKITKLKP